MIDNGHLGELYYIDSVRINLGVFQSDVNVVWDLGSHDVSIIDYLMQGQTPTEVSAIGAAHAGSLRENVAYLTMRYGPSVLAHIHVNWLAPAKIRRTIVGGSRQMAVYDDMQASEKLAVYDKGVTIAPWDDAETVYNQLVSYRSGDMRAPRLDTREALAVEAEEIIECIRHGGRPVADAQSGLRTVRILEAAELSMRDGSRSIHLEPDPRHRRGLGGDRLAGSVRCSGRAHGGCQGVSRISRYDGRRAPR
jgi:predicted dehydrogenase